MERKKAFRATWRSIASGKTYRTAENGSNVIESPAGKSRLSLELAGKPTSPKVIRLGKNVREFDVSPWERGYVSRIEVDPENPHLECKDGKALLRKKGMVLLMSLGPIPEGTKVIESHAFPIGLRRKTVRIPSSVRLIKPSAFARTYLHTLILENPGVRLGYGCFASKTLKEVRIRGKACPLEGECFRQRTDASPFIRFVLEESGGDAFFQDGVYATRDGVVLIGNLDEEGGAIIPEWATKLSAHSYEGLRPTSVSIPSSVKEIDNCGFLPRKSCPLHIGRGLERFHTIRTGSPLGGTDGQGFSVDPGNKNFLSPKGSGAILRKADLALVYAEAGSKVPKVTRSIMQNAFLSAPQVLELPEHLEKIESRSFRDSGSTRETLIVRAKNLHSIPLRSLPFFRKILMRKGAGVPVRFFTESWDDPPALSSIRLEEGYDGHHLAGKHALLDRSGKILCRGDGSGTIPQGTEIIALRAFHRTEAKEIIVPEGVKEIEDLAFSECEALTHVHLPSTLERISGNALRSHKAVPGARLSIAPDNPYFYVDQTGTCLIRKDDHTLVLAFGDVRRIPPEVRILREHSLESNTAKELFIPETVTRVEGKFLGGSYFLEVAVEGGLERFAEDAFESADIMNLLLLGPARDIPDSLFYDASRIGKVTFPEGLERIGENAFADCMTLTDASFPSTIRYIGPYAFCNTALKKATLPAGCEVGEEAFEQYTRVRFQEEGNLKKEP